MGVSESTWKVLRICYTVWAIITAIIFFVMSSILYFKFSSSVDEYHLLIDNWQADPIIDIQLIPSIEKSCPAGYDFDGFRFKPSKTKEGCDCSSGGIESSQCCSRVSDDDDCNSCYGDDINQLTFTTFDIYSPDLYQRGQSLSTVNKYKLCTKRLPDHSFIKKAPLTNDFSCKDNQIRCGLFMCVTGDKCPIIKFGKTDDILQTFSTLTEGDIPQIPNGLSTVDDRNGDNGFGFQRFKTATGSSYLYYQRASKVGTETQRFLVESKATEGDGVCIKATDNNKASGRSVFKLDVEQRKTCETDPRYLPTNFKINELTYFSVNLEDSLRGASPDKFWNDYVDDYNYPVSNSINYEVYHRDVVALKPVCREDFDKFLENEDDIENVESALLGVFIVCIILGLQLCCLESWSIWFDGDKTQFYGPLICKKDDRQVYWVMWLAYSKLVCLLGMAIGLLFGYITFQIQQSFISYVLNKNCLDKQTKELFEDIDGHLNGGYLNTIFTFFLIFLFVEPNLAYMWKKIFKKTTKALGCRKKKHKKDKYKSKEEKRQKELDDLKAQQELDKANAAVAAQNQPPPPQQPVIAQSDAQMQNYQAGKNELAQANAQIGAQNQPQQPPQQPYQPQPYVAPQNPQPAGSNNDINSANAFINQQQQNPYQQPQQQQPINPMQ